MKFISIFLFGDIAQPYSVVYVSGCIYSLGTEDYHYTAELTCRVHWIHCTSLTSQVFQPFLLCSSYKMGMTQGTGSSSTAPVIVIQWLMIICHCVGISLQV